MKARSVLLRNGEAWLRFEEPFGALCTHRIDEVPALLRESERLARRRDCYAAGFVSYEAAPAFDPAFQTHAPGALPLLWFGLYRRVHRFFLDARTEIHTPKTWRMNVTREAYYASLARIKQHLGAGDCYQVNYTARLRATWRENGLFPWFMRFARGAPYAAWLDFPAFTVCSASPELFFELQRGRLLARPMKGTRPRGDTPQADMVQRETLSTAVKDRAENLMITDMLRNDMGRIAVPGSVEVPALFAVEEYPTVWQMTSTVRAVTRAPFSEIFAALFPCASVTGAPKAASMGIIRRLETAPREIYTGSIGFLAPRGDVRFNVAIRTAWLDKTQGRMEYGAGGGIVWDSEAEEEYQEALLKAKILSA